jgi:hypothetical protein
MLHLTLICIEREVHINSFDSVSWHVCPPGVEANGHCLMGEQYAEQQQRRSGLVAQLMTTEDLFYLAHKFNIVIRLSFDGSRRSILLHRLEDTQILQSPGA